MIGYSHHSLFYTRLWNYLKRKRQNLLIISLVVYYAAVLSVCHNSLCFRLQCTSIFIGLSIKVSLNNGFQLFDNSFSCAKRIFQPLNKHVLVPKRACFHHSSLYSLNVSFRNFGFFFRFVHTNRRFLFDFNRITNNFSTAMHIDGTESSA